MTAPRHRPRPFDISEGGFRVRLPRRTIEPLARTTVRATMGGANIAILGYVLRWIDVLANQTEAVIAFEADGNGTDAIRRFVLNTQLRARAAAPDSTAPRSLARSASGCCRSSASECWADWLKQQTMLINHYGLNVMDPQARTFLKKNMEAFLFKAGAEENVDTTKKGTIEW